MRKLSIVDGIAYVASQMAGAVVGAFLVAGVWRSWAISTHVGMTQPGLGYTVAGAFTAEVVMTFLLIVTLMAVLSIVRWAHFAGLGAGPPIIALGNRRAQAVPKAAPT